MTVTTPTKKLHGLPPVRCLPIHNSKRKPRACGKRNHERFNCEPLALSAQSRRQWSQQVQRLRALLGQALAGLDSRSLQYGQRGVL